MEDEPKGPNPNVAFIGRKAQIRNKTPAPIQITAEQLLREANERQADEVKPPRQRIVDEEELQEYRVRKRKEYEDTLRRQQHHIGTWIKYAEWEAAQKEFRRARSVFERALNIDYQNVTLWLKYIEMETKNTFVNSARNLYDRVTQLLPRVDQFWFKYAHMEEILGNYAAARAIFERWMEWEPEDKAWMQYVRFEERVREIELARRVFVRYLNVRPTQAAFLKYTKFEEKHRSSVNARAGYEKAIEIVPEDSLDENFFIKFAQFEERQREFERVKVIYEQALKRLPKHKSEELYRKYLAFQKQRGTKDEIETAVLHKRRFQYEEELKENPRNYDTWFDYIRLEEEAGDIERIRDVYERAIANKPPVAQKAHWKRYIYLWINYALFEELDTGDVERCRAIHQKVLSIVPHKQFSFAKLWQNYAEFEVRQLQLDTARKVYGQAIGQCGKEKIFTAYGGLELRLGNVDRCRKIYAKFIEVHPQNPKAWKSLVDLELMAGEDERARAIFEIAIDLENMESPELIWKVYIDMETERNEIENVRNLYKRLLKKTQHYKVFKAFSMFEFDHADNIVDARKIIKQGLEMCKDVELGEERKLLLEHWLDLEKANGDAEWIEKVKRLRPKTVKVRRNIVGEDGTAQGWEEVVKYIFPDDGPQSANLKILEKAKEWKRKQMEAQAPKAVQSIGSS